MPSKDATPLTAPTNELATRAVASTALIVISVAPLNATPLIALAVCSVVAEPALPVIVV